MKKQLFILVLLLLLVAGCSSKTGYHCRECKATVSMSVSRCPNCDAPDPAEKDKALDDVALLDGQAANDHRLRETATGGKPHHDPIQYRKKDARPAITKPEFVLANNAKIAGGTKGIGVSIDGKSRFYPLYVLQYHQVINDTVGNSAIACSY